MTSGEQFGESNNFSVVGIIIFNSIGHEANVKGQNSPTQRKLVHFKKPVLDAT